MIRTAITRRGTRTIAISLDRLRTLATVGVASLLPRAAIVVLTVAVALTLPSVNGFVLVLLVAAGIATTTTPDRLGAGPVVAVAIVAWALGVGTNASVGTVRTVLFAGALYLVHESASLAATVPLGVTVPRALATRWVIGCVPGVLAVAAVALAVRLLGHPHGSSAADLVAVAAAAVAALALAVVVRRAR